MFWSYVYQHQSVSLAIADINSLSILNIIIIVAIAIVIAIAIGITIAIVTAIAIADINSHSILIIIIGIAICIPAIEYFHHDWCFKAMRRGKRHTGEKHFVTQEFYDFYMIFWRRRCFEALCRGKFSGMLAKLYLKVGSFSEMIFWS